MRRINDNNLYLVITEEYCMSKPAVQVAREAIAGGVDIIQIREKHKSVHELAELGMKMASLCKEHDVSFIVNDDPLLAKRVSADGVHLGQEDMSRFSVEMARDTVGPDRIIGVSTHSLEQFKKALSADVDYIAYGPIFTTKTKSYSIGIDDISTVMALATKPVFFIGGITLENIDQILDRDGRNVGLIRAITESSDITKSARELKEKLLRKREVVKK